MTKRKNPIRQKWTGPLAKPIKWSGPLTHVLSPTILGGEPSAESQTENAARFNSASLATCLESLKKLPLLKKQFDIPEGEDSWVALALALAMYSDIPGFRVVHQGEGRGLKRTAWFDGQCISLILDVENVKADLTIKTDREAIRHLVSKPSIYCGKPSPNTGTQEMRAKSLNARLTEARRRVREKHLENFTKPANRAFLRLLFTECKMRQATFDL